MSAKGTLGFIAGSIVGIAAGVAVGVLLAPRSGEESRAMAADAINDAWDTARDQYERNSHVVARKITSMRPAIDATTDELRAKVDRARERMDMLRSSLTDAVSAAGSCAPSCDCVDAQDTGAHVEVVNTTEASAGL